MLPLVIEIFSIFQTKTPLILIEHLYDLHICRFKRFHNVFDALVWTGLILTECVLYKIS